MLIQLLQSLPETIETWAKAIAAIVAVFVAGFVPITTWRLENKKLAKEPPPAAPSSQTVAAIAPAMSAFGDMLMVDGLRQTMMSLKQSIDSLAEIVQLRGRSSMEMRESIEDLRREMKTAREDLAQRMDRQGTRTTGTVRAGRRAGND